MTGKGGYFLSFMYYKYCVNISSPLKMCFYIGAMETSPTNDGDDGAFCPTVHSLPARFGLCQQAQLLIASDCYEYHVFTINSIRLNCTKIVGEYKGRVTGTSAIGTYFSDFNILGSFACVKHGIA